MVYIPDNSHINQNKEYGEIINFQASRGAVKSDGVSREGIVRASDVAHGLFDVSGYENQGKSLALEINDLQYSDATLMQNYMTVMANTMSSEDYGELTRDGIDPFNEEAKVSVTVLDQIKARLAEAGVVIEGYNDDLTREQLLEITGSESMALDIEAAFNGKDIPLAEETVTETVKALQTALEIDGITDGMCDFILRNGVEPTIENLYRVRHSSCENMGNSGGFYSQDVPGYMAKQGEMFDEAKMHDRICETITEAGLTVDAMTESESRWIIENGILYNKTNVATLHELWGMNAPFETEEVLDCITAAIQRGASPLEAHPGEGGDLRREAEDNYRRFNEMIKEDNPDAAKARLLLEETRVAMTYESSYKLVKRGMTVDTVALSEMVNTLKALEDRTNRILFGNGNETDAVINERATLYNETKQAIKELPFVPASVLGERILENKDITIGYTVKAGLALKARFDEAKETYETLGTTVRGDLGDNIKKAFANAGELLKEIGLKENETNLRGVRILGYNRMEVTAENILKVTSADAMLSRITDKMTPGTTLKLIRDGVNPLEISIEELEKKIDAYDKGAEKEADNYARFLYKLEGKSGITDEERESFIGIYRMLHALDKSDGAALGTLVNTGAEITFKNLLSSLRTGKALKSGIDVKVTEDVGELAEAAGYEGDISAQILTAFMETCTQGDEGDYRRRELARMREELSVGEEAVTKLIKMGEKITPDMLAGMNELLSESAESSLWKTLKKQKWDETEEKIKKYKASFKDEQSAREAFEDIVADVGDKLADVCLNDDIKPLDIQELKSAYKQLSLAGKLIKEETYSLPVEIDGKQRDLRIKIVHNSGVEGNVTATFESETFGRITALFTIKDGEVEGLIAGNDKDGLEKLKNTENLTESLKKGGFKDGVVRYIHSENLNYTSLYLRENLGNDRSDTTAYYKVAQIFMDEIERAGMSK